MLCKCAKRILSQALQETNESNCKDDLIIVGEGEIISDALAQSKKQTLAAQIIQVHHLLISLWQYFSLNLL